MIAGHVDRLAASPESELFELVAAMQATDYARQFLKMEGLDVEFQEFKNALEPPVFYGIIVAQVEEVLRSYRPGKTVGAVWDLLSQLEARWPSEYERYVLNASYYATRMEADIQVLLDDLASQLGIEPVEATG